MKRLSLRGCAGSIFALAVSTAGPLPAHAQGFGDLALGVALDKLGDEVNQAVLNAGNVGQATEIEAGREASIAIAEAKNAYADSLDKTVKTLDPEVRQSIDQIKSLADGVANNTITSVADAESRLQQITNSLPFANNEPQVTSVTPRFVVPARNSYPVRISFKGNFINAAQNGLTPSLTINHKTYTGAVTTQEVVFLVPVSEIFPVNPGADTSKFRATTVSLDVPWLKSEWLGLWHEKKDDKFSVFVGALPPSPGSLILSHTVTGSNHVVRTFTSQNFHICSTGECGNNDDIDHHVTVRPDTGWHVVRGSSRAGVGSAQGDHSGPNFVADDGDQVTYTATTIHHRFGSSGSIDFSISFQEYQDQPTTTTVSEPVALLWGDSKLINYPAGSWKLAVTTFDGNHLEFAGVDSSQKFVNVGSSGGTDSITTANPATLVWP